MNPFTSLMSAVVIVAALLVPASPSHEPGVCPRCAWRAPDGLRTVEVRTADALHRAVTNARRGDTILLADGRYPLQRPLEIAAPDVTLRSGSGDPDRVVLHGRGMQGDHVGVAVGVGATGVTIADVTIRAVGFHAVQVRGERGASNFTLHNAKLYDTGQQLLKGSTRHDGQLAADGLVACSEFGFTTSAPSDYTDGVDILGTRAWVIRDNRFLRIRGPAARGWKGGPAILAWQAAEDTVVERNLIVDSFRGIALGLRDRHGERDYDHLRGVIRNNVVVNLNPWADEAIEANGARDARIEHNTVLVEGAVPWSIGVRFPTGSADVRNNLTNRPPLERNGGRARLSGNVATAMRSWFVNAPGVDLRLVSDAVRAIDAGVAIPGVEEDFDRAPRPVGRAPDAGAFEYPPGRMPAKK